jgi:hypothetical protein
MGIVRRSLLAFCCLVALLFSACAGGAAPITSGFPANANHPQPVAKTFQGCPPEGDGGDAQLNVHKNRIDDGENGSFHDVALATLLQLQWPQGIERAMRDNWAPSDASAVGQYEGVAVRTTGYLVGVRHEGTESPNCHAVDYRDFHMWLVQNPSDDKSTSMVVEVTPRVRDQRPGWTDSALSKLTGEQVRISGWLMMDQEHPEQVGKTRATLWEIHPILHIEVNQNGDWQSIDS